MFRTCVLLAVVVCALGSAIQPRVPQLDGRIVGGSDATIQAYPYQVSVRWFGSHICGGSIIKSDVVITAAHCVDGSANSYSIMYGQNQLNAVNPTVISVSMLIIHPFYSWSNMDYDMALLILATSIQISNVAQIIPLPVEVPATGTTAVVTGWGTKNEGGSISNTLQQVSVQIVDIKICREQYKNIGSITDRMSCAGVVGGGKDACQGDSGGPLVAGGKLVGIVSWGFGCARPNYAGVYTNVANLRSWIENNW